MKLCWNDALAKYNKNYLEMLPGKKKELKPEQQELFELWLSVLDYNGNNAIEDLKVHMHAIAAKEGTTTVEQLQHGTIGDVVSTILGDEYAIIFRAWLKLEGNCPIENAENRRSQRSSLLEAHFDNLHGAMLALLKLRSLQWTDEQILLGGSTEKEKEEFKAYSTAEWMAAKILLGNSAVINHIKNAIEDSNNTKIAYHQIFKAIAISGNHELLELEGKLLTPKQQDGLKQVICEHMNDGQPESFVYLMDIIMARNLQHLAPIQKAFESAIGFDFLTKEELKSLIEALYRCLKHKNHADKLIHSDKPLDIYISIWSKGFYDLNNLNIIVPLIISKGRVHQVRALFLYLYKIATKIVSLCQLSSSIALPRWKNDQSIITVLLKIYLPNINFGYFSRFNPSPDYRHYFSSQQTAIEEYYILKEILTKTPTKQMPTGDNCLMVYRDEVLEAMCKIAYLLPDEKKVHDDICDFVEEFSSDVRTSFFSNTLHHPNTEKQKRTVAQALSDRSSEVRAQVIAVLNDIELDDTQYQILEDTLRMKYPDMRVAVIQLLMKQSEDKLAATLTRLLHDKDVERRLAGLDIILQLGKTNNASNFAGKVMPLVTEMKKPSSKEQVLINEILKNNTVSTKETITPTRANGFGLYDPKMEVTIPDVAPDKDFDIDKAFLFMTSGEALKICKKLSDLIEASKDLEFLNNRGEVCHIGNEIALGYYSNYLPELAYSEIWKDFYEREIADPAKMIQICFMIESGVSQESDYDKRNNEAKDFTPILDKLYGNIKYKGLSAPVYELPYCNKVIYIMEALAGAYIETTTYYYYSIHILQRLLTLLDEKNIYHRFHNKHVYFSETDKWGEKEEVYPIQCNKYVNFWLDKSNRTIDDALFTRHFTLRYQLYKLTNYMEHNPKPEENNSYIRGIDMVRAYQLGLIPKEEVYRETLGRDTSHNKIESVSLLQDNNHWTYYNNKEYYDLKSYDFTPSQPMVKNIIDLILDIELKRGDSETEVSEIAFRLHHVLGAETLVHILKAIGRISFSHETKYYFSGRTKKDALSQLLYKCYPLPSDTPASLKKLIEQEGISEERLVDVAMYAPQWMELVEETIKWKGLASAGYFFHAHTTDLYSKKRQFFVAHHTPFNVEDLYNGTFDINWFKEVYKTIGEKRFNAVCTAAKNIASSSCHIRIRKFIDAVSGKLSATKIKNEATSTHNKDLLMCYGLIPLDSSSNKDLIERYQYLKQFNKLSFGLTAQAQVSEKKAISMAMQNLAQNAGYENITQFIWQMEIETIKDMLPYFVPRNVEGVEAYIMINEEGKPEIKLAKNGKELNSIPQKLKKHPLMEKLKDMHEQLDSEYNNSCTILEHAMEAQTPFSVAELNKFMQHPIAGVLLKNLLFICNEGIGFYANGKLIKADGGQVKLTAKMILRIVHPIDLQTESSWKVYLSEKSLHQPFEQISRKFICLTEEENSQPFQFVGKELNPYRIHDILQKRNWIKDSEYGLQKIFFKENIIAAIHAVNDWFSYHETEETAIEYVNFYNRKNHKLIKMSDVPPIIFSEVMRDIDAMVNTSLLASYLK